jgi:feruloyl esterase
MSSVDYYNAVRRMVGPGADDFVRLYMLPGVAHCSGGEGPDRINLIDPIMAWVEDGIAPDAILLSRKSYGRTLQTRPVFPFPKTARYSGKGDPNQADSFVPARP